MLYVALQMLFGDRIKYLSLVAGVAFATLLMIQQASIFAGLTYQTGTPVRSAGGGIDLWVMDPDVEFSQEQKPVADTLPDRVRGIDGVDWAVPYVQVRRSARLADGSLKTVQVIGLDDATLIGGPPAMANGALGQLREDKAVIVEERELANNLARVGPDGARVPMAVGDEFSINDESVRVVGVFRRERSFFWEPVVYTTYSRALSLAPPERRMNSFVLVGVKAGHDRSAVAARIASATGYKVLTGGEFIELTALYVLFKTGILINFSISVGLGLIIGVLVSAQTFYNFVLDNLRHFAVLKAIGLSTPTIVAMVFLQTLVVGALGFGIGAGTAALFGEWFRTVGPGAFLMVWQIPAFVSVAILVTCLVAAGIPLIRVLRLEPAIVFRS